MHAPGPVGDRALPAEHCCRPAGSAISDPSDSAPLAALRSYRYADFADPGALRAPRLCAVRCLRGGRRPKQVDQARGEGNAYAEALRSAGGDVFARTYDGLSHTLLNLFPISPVADSAVTELYAQLKKRLS
ncbi:hypothetical protein ACWGHM_13290 [Streptomyces sp. NPDC054904]|uniref:hypothetical protein n=1 Tax=Streptomyces sp. NPDC090054 TaxID=3365933 RepID=UPI00381E91F6